MQLRSASSQAVLLSVAHNGFTALRHRLPHPSQPNRMADCWTHSAASGRRWTRSKKENGHLRPSLLHAQGHPRRRCGRFITAKCRDCHSLRFLPCSRTGHYTACGCSHVRPSFVSAVVRRDVALWLLVHCSTRAGCMGSPSARDRQWCFALGLSGRLDAHFLYCLVRFAPKPI